MDDKERTSASADLETANLSNNDILTPLLLLVAARRSFQNDSSLVHTAVPGDFVISYRGRSGVKAVNHTPLLVRFICGIGYAPMGLQYVIFKAKTIIGTPDSNCSIQCVLSYGNTVTVLPIWRPRF